MYHPNINLSKFDKKILEKSFYYSFFTAEYTKRCFAEKVLNDDMQKNKFTKNLETFEKNLAVNFKISDARMQEIMMEDLIQQYHQKNFTDPRYAYTPILNFPEDQVDHVLSKNHEVIKYLHKITFEFGLFPNDLVFYMPSEEILKNLVEDKLLSMEIPISFIKKDKRIPHDCEFFFANSKNEKFYSPEDDGYIFIYGKVSEFDINSLETMTEEQIKSLLKSNIRYETDIEFEKIPGHLKSARNKKKSIIGCSEASNIQIRIMKNTDYEPLFIKRWCELGVRQHALWLQGFALAGEDSLELFWTIYSKKFDQLPVKTRAIGLILWDSLHSGLSRIEAFDYIRNLNIPHLRASAEDRQLDRDLKLTRACVKYKTFLDFADLRKI